MYIYVVIYNSIYKCIYIYIFIYIYVYMYICIHTKCIHTTSKYLRPFAGRVFVTETPGVQP